MSDQVHVISTLKVLFTKAVYVLCKKLLKVFGLANFSGEAVLHIYFQGFTILLKNDA